MRGGPLAERRIIDLMNRRFVAYYFNVGRNGNGFNQQASEFIHRVDQRFQSSAVPTPPIWIFNPEGELIVTIDNYLEKNRFFEQLRGVLGEHKAFDTLTEQEQSILSEAKDAPDDEAKNLEAARLLDELGNYDQALALAGKLKSDEARLLEARIARYQTRWDDAANILEGITTPHLKADVALEDALRFVQHEKYREAHGRLLAAIEADPTSRVIGALHFYAGVANFMMDRKDWANYHWGWILANAPDDHMYMRAYMASTAEAMPYPNSELKGYRSSNNMISHQLADAARDRAMSDYERLKEQPEPLSISAETLPARER